MNETRRCFLEVQRPFRRTERHLRQETEQGILMLMLHRLVMMLRRRFVLMMLVVMRRPEEGRRLVVAVVDRVLDLVSPVDRLVGLVLHVLLMVAVLFVVLVMMVLMRMMMHQGSEEEGRMGLAMGCMVMLVRVDVMVGRSVGVRSGDDGVSWIVTHDPWFV